MSRFPRWIIVLDILAASVLLTISAIALYWAAVPVRTFEVSKIEVLNTGGTVRPGEALLYKAQYCKYVALQSQTVKQLIGGGAVYPLPTSYGNVPKGCGSVVSRTTLIPVGVANGTYKVQFSITYQVNPLRQETVRFETPSFQVVTGTATEASTGASATGQVTETTLSSADAQATRTATGTPSRSSSSAAAAAVQTVTTDEVSTDDLPTPLPATPAPSLVGRTLGSILDLLP